MHFKYQPHICPTPLQLNVIKKIFFYSTSRKYLKTVAPYEQDEGTGTHTAGRRMNTTRLAANAAMQGGLKSRTRIALGKSIRH